MTGGATPSSNGDNGRDAGGRWAKGNRGGPGNPHARRVARLRAELLRAVSPQDLREIVLSLVAKAKAGDILAAREVLDRLFGRPAQALDVAARVSDERGQSPFEGEPLAERQKRIEAVAELIHARRTGEIRDLLNRRPLA